jgi:RluA family pseudouridine synthase
VSKPDFIELPGGEMLPILYEDRAVLAIDKPAGWMLVPFNWQRTNYNLQAALVSSIAARDFWARSRDLRYLRYVHRLDAETTGVLLFGKSPGSVRSLGALFESRRMEKVYLAVVEGSPAAPEWVCRLPLGSHPDQRGRMRVDARNGKAAETQFRVLRQAGGRTLLEARPLTGRTHQIRVHLAEARLPIVGDPLYGGRQPVAGAKPAGRRGEPEGGRFVMGLRAIKLAYVDPFTRRPVEIRAPVEEFLRAYGLAGVEV